MRLDQAARDSTPAIARPREAGVILLVVLLTVTLLTIVVVEFTYSTQVDEHIVLSRRNALQAYYLARSGLNVAHIVLSLDANLTSSDSVHDLWAKPVPPFPAGDGMVTVRIQDERGKLNLNDLLGQSGNIKERSRLILERLFTLLGIQREVLHAILDWLDSDNEPWSDPAGAEQPYYLSLNPPLEPRNGELLTLRELLLVRGVDRDLLKRLSEVVTVLPRSSSTRVNINTAPAEVIFSLSDRMMRSPGVVARILDRRERAPIEKLSQLREISGAPELISEIAHSVRFDSDYFSITAVGAVATVSRAVTETVERSTSASRQIKTIAWRPAIVPASLTTGGGSDFLAALGTLKAGLEASR